jgi:alpha-tubulin suppressor-like RCC1 family protein
VTVATTRSNAVGSQTTVAAVGTFSESPPWNTVSPSLSGSSVYNTDLIIDRGSWAGYPNPSFSIQWFRCGEPYPIIEADVPAGCTLLDAHSTSYKVSVDDLGSYLIPVVTASNSLGSASQIVYSAVQSTSDLILVDPPTMVDAVLDMSNGFNHACAIMGNRTVNCWGANAVGQLGNGTTTASLEPVEVEGLTNARALSLSDNTSCALLLDGTVKCWGGGLLGDGNSTGSLTPVTVVGISSAVKISIGPAGRCVVLENGELHCWGANHMPFDGSSHLTPVKKASNVKSVTVGPNNTCYISIASVMTCVGYAAYGVNSYNKADVVDVGVTGFNACAVRTSGDVNCWGYDPNSVAPATVSVSSAVSISMSDNNSCVVLTTGIVKCWGTNNYGQLGNGTRTKSSTPVTAIGVANAVGVSVRTTFSCAKLVSHSFKCWGDNTAGQLGDLSNARSLLPIFPAIPTRAVGQTLRATPGSWIAYPANTIYDWYRCDAPLDTQSPARGIPVGCTLITGENGPIYTQTAADVGKYVTLRMTIVGSPTVSRQWPYSPFPTR